MKRASPGLRFSAQNVASDSEVRAFAHIGSALNRIKGSQAKVVSDESIKEKLDVDFISFGFLKNSKTQDLFSK